MKITEFHTPKKNPKKTHFEWQSIIQKYIPLTYYIKVPQFNLKVQQDKIYKLSQI